ncbi:PA0061/PA0062 family lipoprotein [Metapseudomonas furukawaii]|jgi:hypothetical protein|uniref:Lipoprotein, putative n=1 Tax=Metapseudomonas furukawaii TaxID=1149133 RepID=A0AAD1BXN3_METFU|nr:hypothetical protein [Pseudomonas furukawaii]ELS29948.1 lipoprotein, putative [Pseudomonas furukawaii]WAG79169.1 hypothetical protein LMK08_00425 [Pseudomonas furukawaii]BAU71724.1 lipoprotein, putative [Pseudomonas furukawaii]
MRPLLLSLPLLSLGGCALLMPSHDPSQAWIALDAREGQSMQASRVDDKPLSDPRFFQVTPGRHELEVRLEFEVGAGDIGQGSDGYRRTCLLKLAYADFTAGERYQLQAGGIGFRPWVRLYDERNREVAKARESRCGDV